MRKNLIRHQTDEVRIICAIVICFHKVIKVREIKGTPYKKDVLFLDTVSYSSMTADYQVNQGRYSTVIQYYEIIIETAKYSFWKHT